jgi:pimeloyl-ACP methyl ester carboxylesterase
VTEYGAVRLRGNDLYERVEKTDFDRPPEIPRTALPRSDRFRDLPGQPEIVYGIFRNRWAFRLLRDPWAGTIVRLAERHHDVDAVLAPVFGDPFNANQVILVDFLDQGQSDRLEGQVYDQSIQVRLLVALLDHLKLPKASFAGISYGGEVALRLAVDHPERVERLILLNTTAYTSPQLLDVGRAWNKAAATGDGQAYYYTTIPVIYSPSFYERKLDWMRRREAYIDPGLFRRAFYSRDDPADLVGRVA